jgi:hypothetical protein
MENYASYEDFIVSSEVGKLVEAMSKNLMEFEKKFIKGDRGSFWHIKFNGTEFLLSVVPVLTAEVPKKENESKTLYYSRVIESWRK